MKKIILTLLCIFFALALPCLCFAEGTETPPEENIVGRVMNVVWYVILVVLFGGGLILISKWSKRINERDAELEQQLQQIAKEEEAEQQEDPSRQSQEENTLEKTSGEHQEQQQKEDN